ncbi:MAG: acyloxyacyl hydrolase [Pseudomonadota bacterium]|nr:acyloxyacyl hydrolase [Pseudomonadota bacterium]
MKTFGKLTIALIAVVIFSSPAAADKEPAFISLATGATGVIADRAQGAAFNVEYRSDFDFWKIRPFVGGFATSDASIYGYFGLLVDIYFGRRWVLTPNTAVGAYAEGDGQDLGHVIEFRSGLELAYRFDDRSRLGFAVHHLSNASIGSKNPGTETALLYYSIPLDSLFD